jgi:hypothetical protein
VFFHFDELMSPPIAPMSGNESAAVEQSNVLIVRADGDRPIDPGWGNRVPIGVEASKGRLVDANRRNQIDIGQGIGQAKKPRLLLLEKVRDGPFWMHGMRASMTRFLDKLEQLSVTVRKRVKGASRKESLLQPSDQSLDLSFFVGLSDATEAGQNVHLGGESEQVVMEARRVAVALRNDGFGVIEQPLTWIAIEERCGSNQRTQQGEDV